MALKILQFCFIFILLLVTKCSFSQNTVYRQFWNEFQFTHPFADKFAVELDLSNSFSDTPENRKVLTTHTQFASVLLLNYYHSAKWKFSAISSYFSNYYVPEIGQREYPELRTSVEAVYFFNKINYIFQTRGRIEYRLIQNTEGNFEDVLRYRQFFKYTQPFNSNYIRQGTFYGFVSEEVFLKAPSNITGQQIFDRNMATVALGYAFTDNVQADIDYTFEYAPRSTGNLITFAIQLNINIVNPFVRVYERLKKK